uniref:BPTI/Kunitz inhibitor domain-containing protein n=1 Tax=Anolis carolinensis TaxID=28377 RepID=A0A803TLL6_ANOCA
MYYYDPVGTICEEFVYKGHEGNPNRFATLTECEETCRDPDTCHLPSKPGPCAEHLPRWYYDSSRGTCSEFSFGGCRSNTNNFESQEQCQQTCKGPEKPGFCPREDSPTSLMTCLKDCQCHGAQKCCSTPWGQTCRDPVQGERRRALGMRDHLGKSGAWQREVSRTWLMFQQTLGDSAEVKSPTPEKLNFRRPWDPSVNTLMHKRQTESGEPMLSSKVQVVEVEPVKQQSPFRKK